MSIIALIRRSAQRWARTPLGREALEQARSSLAHSVERAYQDQAERLLEPRRWALFHARMVTTLPAKRWLARAHHRRLARIFQAHVWVEEHKPCPPRPPSPPHTSPPVAPRAR